MYRPFYKAHTVVEHTRRCGLEEQSKTLRIFDVYIGGIFAEPKKSGTRVKANPTQAKRNLVELLGRTKDKVEKVWKLDKDEHGEARWSFGDCIVGRVVEHEFKDLAYSWLNPVIFRLKVNKGTKFSGLNKRKGETIGSIDAIVVYNGIWFMTLVDDTQFSSFEECYASGSSIRDILIGILETNKRFIPVVVPPCIIPKPFDVEVYAKKDGEGNHSQRNIKYISTSSSQDPSRLTVKYETESANIAEEDVIEIIKDIYFDVCSSLDSFYTLAQESNRTQDERNNVSEMYDEACNYLQEYIKVPFWNIFKKCQVANALRKNVSNIQVQLVRNRFSQVSTLNEAGEIDRLRDSKGIIENMRAYLKECVVKDFNLGAVEYEGLTGTLSYIDRLASQHNTILLGVVAIIAGVIGAVIGAWIG